MSICLTDDHLQKATALVRNAHVAGGLAPVNLDKFWEDQDKAAKDPWAKDCPQMPLGMQMSWECVFDELGIPETSDNWYRLLHDPEWSFDCILRYNDKAESIVGRRILAERKNVPVPDQCRIKGLHDIFEANNIWHNESYWMQQSADSEEELDALLDRVEKRLENLRTFLLPDNWPQEMERCKALGAALAPYRGQRGPVTFATSVYGVENLIYLLHDNVDLAKRFSDLILKSILERARIIDEELGNTEEKRGWGWADDNCCLLNKDLYDFFAKPILKGVYERYSPDAKDSRYQHSDSDMAQHLPTFRELGMNGVNFGPNLTVRQIRDALPEATIYGQLAPFTLSRNEEVNIVAECIRDCEMARPEKGVVLSTAGSINNGTRLSGMRLLMAAIQEFGRY